MGITNDVDFTWYLPALRVLSSIPPIQAHKAIACKRCLDPSMPNAHNAGTLQFVISGRKGGNIHRHQKILAPSCQIVSKPLKPYLAHNMMPTNAINPPFDKSTPFTDPHCCCRPLNSETTQSPPALRYSLRRH